MWQIFKTKDLIWNLFFLLIVQISIIFLVLQFFDVKRKFDFRPGQTYIYEKEFNGSSDKLDFIAINHYINRLQRLSQDMWSYLHVFTIENYNEKTKLMLDQVSDMKNVLQIEITELEKKLNVNTWRDNELFHLSELVKSQISELQNPKSPKQCLSDHTIICNHTNGHGFAAGFHDIVWCLIAGYYSNKTVILLTSNYHYLRGGNYSWDDIFMPLSETCKEKSIIKNLSNFHSHWPGENNPISRRLLHYLPKSIAPKIVALHSNPMVWWFGQFVGYILRPQQKLKKYLQERKNDINFTHPVVGIHVRRTDKLGVEGGFHDLSEYMTYVEDFYNKFDLLDIKVERKVYLATDDPFVWDECHKKYSNYTFIGNKQASFAASKINTRYNIDAFWDLLSDIFLLAQTDYLVCTFTSGVCHVRLALDRVCRTAYELMQYYHYDIAQMAQSLDVPFHYAWVQNPPRIAVYNHKSLSSGQWSLKIGSVMYNRNGEDFVGQAVNGKKYDGFFYGTDQKHVTNDNNMSLYLKYPSYKTVQQIPIY